MPARRPRHSQNARRAFADNTGSKHAQGAAPGGQNACERIRSMLSNQRTDLVQPALGRKHGDEPVVPGRAVPRHGTPTEPCCTHGSTGTGQASIKRARQSRGASVAPAKVATAAARPLAASTPATEARALSYSCASKETALRCTRAWPNAARVRVRCAAPRQGSASQCHFEFEPARQGNSSMQAVRARGPTLRPRAAHGVQACPGMPARPTPYLPSPPTCLWRATAAEDTWRRKKKIPRTLDASSRVKAG